MKPRRWGFATAVLVLAAALVGIKQLDAPIVLYPASDSLPKRLYLQTFGTPEIGKIAAFPIPEAARNYQARHRNLAPEGFLFMKPIVAGPSDEICNGPGGLFLNGRNLAATASHDAGGNSLPIWNDCRPLKDDEFFMLSDYASNSFDSRYSGPIGADDIVGVYRAAF